METLINAIQALKQRDAWDYVAMVTPLILSSVAIWISIHTTRKQNKIALFESRFSVFHIFCFLLSVTQNIVDNSKKEDTSITTEDILVYKMQTYILCNSPQSENIDNDRYDYFYSHLALETIKVSLLFKKEETSALVSLSTTFNNIVAKVSRLEDFEDDLTLLEELEEEIRKDKTMNKLEKHLKL